MKTSQHAQARMQQRGLSPDVVELILLLGSRVAAQAGVERIALEEKDRKRLCKQFRQALRILEKPQSPYVVVTEEDVILTCAHPVKQRRRERQRAHAWRHPEAA